MTHNDVEAHHSEEAEPPDWAIPRAIDLAEQFPYLRIFEVPLLQGFSSQKKSCSR